MEKPNHIGLTFVLRWLVNGWQDYCSPFAMPICQPNGKDGDPEAQRRIDDVSALKARDGLVVVCLVLSVVAFALAVSPVSACWRLALCGLLLFRIVDITMTTLSMGWFGYIRSHLASWSISRSRLQRQLVLNTLNYVEMIFWFATAYQIIALTDPAQFTFPGRWEGWHPLVLSVQTVTTVGYGNVAPAGWWSTVACGWQAIEALFFFATVIGTLIGLIAGDRSADGLPPVQPERRHWCRYLAPLTIGAVLTLMPLCVRWFGSPTFGDFQVIEPTPQKACAACPCNGSSPPSPSTPSRSVPPVTQPSTLP